jgi:hypothetical protein
MLSLFSFATVTCQSDRVKGWSSDIDYLFARIKEQHYIYRSKPLPPALVQAAAELKAKASEYSDERMLVELQGLMFHLGDGHSYILPLFGKDIDSRYLPLQLYEFSDGMFVVSADDANQRLVGMKVTQIAGVSVERMMKEMETFISQDNVHGAKWIGPTAIRFRGTIEKFGLPKGSPDVAVKFEDRRGRSLESRIAFVVPTNFQGIPKLGPPPASRPESMAMYLSKVGDNYWFRHLPERNTIYFQFNQVQNKDGETIRDFAGKLDAELESKKPRLLVVDVRHNNGGNSYLFPPLVNSFKKFESLVKGRIVVLTGRNTFSAAQNFISTIDRETNAIFAGEPSSSKPNFVGEENEVVLPFSGARGSISNRYHEMIPGDTRQWIVPDLDVRSSSKDYFENRDRLLEEVLKKYSK